MISLFEQQAPIRRGVSSVALSCIVHGVGFSMVSYGILHAPRVNAHVITERYSVRHLELHVPDAPAQTAEDAPIPYPGKDAGKSSLQAAIAEDQPPAPVTPPLPETAKGLGGKQTLLQPEFHTHQSLADFAPIPSVVIWTPELASKKLIVAPTPDAPTASTAKPALDAPNDELKLTDVAMAASEMQPKIATPPPGTTSPIRTDTVSLVQMAPATMSVSAQEPTPTTVLSLSSLRMNEGSVTIPPVNETQMKVDAKQTARAQPTKASGTAKAGSAIAVAAAGKPSPTAVPGGTNTAATQSASALNAAGPANTQRIVLPKDGKFGVVVVGSSLSGDYPEALQIWNDRVAYTAYLHVGLSKNWILQYSQLRSTDAAHAGTVGRLEAPWPYDILRPNLISADLNADALMIHGIVNQEGRFENLAVAFPADFDHASFVLHALQEWQFRPARQNGKPTAVEVLLIIPDELE